MNDLKMEDGPRIERLISMAERLVDALESDIAALKSGNVAALRTADPEIQKLTVLYGREAQGFDPRIAQAAPPSMRQRLAAITAKFREVLQLHGRLLARMKNASEGMVQANRPRSRTRQRPDPHLWPAPRLCAAEQRRDGVQQGRLSTISNTARRGILWLGQELRAVHSDSVWTARSP